MIGYLSGWAAAGFGVRVYQLAIMKRNIFESKHPQWLLGTGERGVVMLT